MSKKRKPKKPKLSKEAQIRLDLAGSMMAEVLQQGGLPEIVIAAKPIHSAGYLDYFIASPLKKEEILHVLRRVTGLLDGTLPIRRPSEMN